MSISRSSALSTNVVLVFDIHDINGGLFLNTTSFCVLSCSFGATAKIPILPFTTIYASL